MMNKDKIIILSPDPSDRMNKGRWRDIFSQISHFLNFYEIDTESVPWTEPVEKLAKMPNLILPLLAWGYQRDYSTWLKMCREWKNHDVKIENDPNILIWNSDKTYLRDLQDRGAPVVPSIYHNAVSYQNLMDSLSVFDVNRVVLKPTVSATAYKTSVWEEGQPIRDEPDGPCIIQPYLPLIETEGEISLIFIDGHFSHALRKVPISGDFRVQPEFGGILSPYTPEHSAIQAAKKVLKAIGPSLLYARIDLVLGDSHRWLLLEAELIEPDLFIKMDKNNGKLIGQALKMRIKNMINI